MEGNKWLNIVLFVQNISNYLHKCLNIVLFVQNVSTYLQQHNYLLFLLAEI